MKQDFIQANPMILRALGEAMDRRVERIPATERTFSPAFEQRMNRLIRAQSKPYYRFVNTTPKKALLALAAAILLMITMMFSVAALREPVVRFIVEVYEKFSQVFIHQEEEAQFPAMLEIYYTPAWLPEGYRENEDQMIDALIFCERTYVNENEDEIKFKQHTITTFVLHIDTEAVQAKPCLVNGKDGLYYSNKGIQNLIWNFEQYGFHVSGPVPEADLLRMAESLREK